MGEPRDRDQVAPVVVLVTGPPGTGKSTVAEAVAGAAPATVLGWDWAMAALTWCEPVQDAFRRLDVGSYRRIGWRILENLADAQLRDGRSVVLDGLAREEHVTMVRDLAHRNAVRSVVVVTGCADRARLRHRIEGRQRAIPGWHELTWDHVERVLADWEPPTDADLVVDTSDDPPAARIARDILAFVRAAGP